MRRMPGGGLRKLLIAAVAALIVAAMAGPASAAVAPAATVEVRGGDILQPGQFIKNNFRFVPRNITVNSGDVVRWVDRDRDEDDPHTVTIARKADLPQNIAQLDACYEPGGFCITTIEAHDPGLDEQPPFNFRVNRGGPGLDTRGDSLLFGGPFDQAIRGGSPRLPAGPCTTCVSFILGCRAASRSSSSAAHDRRGLENQPPLGLRWRVCGPSSAAP